MLTYVYKLIQKNQGSISLADFINAALYHKEYGYYMSKVSLGKTGDFITAPEISQLFGETIAIWVMYTWKMMQKPSKFSLIELGPGKGTLMQDIIRVTKKYSDFFSAMSVHLVEISPVLRDIQKQTLKHWDVKWHEDIDDLPEQTSIFIANEFFDALPIDQFIYTSKQWHENSIAKQENGKFQIIQIPCLKKTKKDGLFDGATLEICTAGVEILKKIEKRIFEYKGAAVIIDYGYVYPTYTSTLQSIREHRYNNFLENVGSSDITALVNFQALKESLEHTNCEILTQREFLYSFGIRERMQLLMKNADDSQKHNLLSKFLRLTENMGTLFKVMLIHN